MWALKQCSALSWRWQHAVAFSLLLCLRICYSGPLPPSCRQPCDNAECGPEIESGGCMYGTFTRCGGCCVVCANGPQEWCDPYELENIGPCGEGLECVGAVPGIRPGTCEWIPTPPTTSEPVPSPSPSPSSSPTLPVPTTETTPTVEGSTEDGMSVVCRGACTVEFCSERETKKRRICSAAGLSPVVPERNKCQHTTCRACFKLREPDCSGFACPAPPTKDCLRRFYGCVRDHYFGPLASSNLLPLEDSRAWTTPGRVVCSVPDVSIVQGSFDGQDSTTSASGP